MQWLLSQAFKAKYPARTTYGPSLFILALTGPIAGGKSSVCNFFHTLGICTISADDLVKQVYKKVSTHRFIKQHFPSAYKQSLSELQDCPPIDFTQLRELIFHSSEKRTLLESFIHPQLKEIFLKTQQSYLLPQSNFIIYEVPLLFEKSMQSQFSATITLFTPISQCLDRLEKRDKISRELAQHMLSAQLSPEEKTQKADFILNNTSSKEVLHRTCLHFLNRITFS